jgi:hypothetical protein
MSAVVPAPSHCSPDRIFAPAGVGIRSAEPAGAERRYPDGELEERPRSIAPFPRLGQPGASNQPSGLRIGYQNNGIVASFDLRQPERLRGAPGCGPESEEGDQKDRPGNNLCEHSV